MPNIRHHNHECDDHVPKIDMVLALHGVSPTMRSPTASSTTKTLQQQSELMLHRAGHLFIRQQNNQCDPNSPIGAPAASARLCNVRAARATDISRKAK
jgi:hypothetical protein